MSILVQKIDKKYKTNIDVAIKYYGILSILNDLRLSPMDVNILAYAAINGNISTGGMKDGFAAMFDCSKASINGNMYKLIALGFLVKRDKKVVVNPAIVINITEALILQLNLTSSGIQE